MTAKTTLCACQSDIEARLLKRFVEQSPEATAHNATLMGYALIYNDNGLVSKGCMPIEFTAVHPLKKGGSKSKTSKQNMIFSFCPFCGVKYPSNDEVGAA